MDEGVLHNMKGPIPLEKMRPAVSNSLEKITSPCEVVLILTPSGVWGSIFSIDSLIIDALPFRQGKNRIHKIGFWPPMLVSFARPVELILVFPAIKAFASFSS
jgi:hypothetical protein